MNHSRTLIPVCSLLATALLAFAQTPAPRAAAAPPATPDAWEQTPPAAPRPAAAPIAPAPPSPPANAWDQAPPAAPRPAAAPTPRAMPAPAPLPPLPPLP